MKPLYQRQKLSKSNEKTKIVSSKTKKNDSIDLYTKFKHHIVKKYKKNCKNHHRILY
jgi:ribosomal protein S17